MWLLLRMLLCRGYASGDRGESVRGRRIFSERVLHKTACVCFLLTDPALCRTYGRVPCDQKKPFATASRTQQIQTKCRFRRSRETATVMEAPHRPTVDVDGRTVAETAWRRGTPCTFHPPSADAGRIGFSYWCRTCDAIKCKPERFVSQKHRSTKDAWKQE